MISVVVLKQVSVVGYIYLKELEDVKNVVGMFSALDYTLDFTAEVNFSCFYTLFQCFCRTHVAFFGRRHDY